MKIKLLTLVIATLALVSCNKSTFNVNVELQNAEGKMVTIPMHNGDIPIGTANAILKSIGAKK